MDRNGLGFGHFRDDVVALRKESVDRNGLGLGHFRDDVVALRKESVDRNIPSTPTSQTSLRVALRKESVDRNADLVLNA